MQPLNVVEMLGNPKYTHPLPEITVGTALRAAKRAAGLIVYSIWAASSGSYRDDGVCPRCWGIKSFRQEAEPGASPAGFTQATARVMRGSGENARGSHEVLSFVHAFSPDHRLGEPRNIKTGNKNQTKTHRGAPAALPPAPQTRSRGSRCAEPGGREALRGRGPLGRWSPRALRGAAGEAEADDSGLSSLRAKGRPPARLQPPFAGAERGARPFGWLEAPDPAGHSVIVQPAPHRVNNFPGRKAYI